MAGVSTEGTKISRINRGNDKRAEREELQFRVTV